jgi:hypothetical protein
MFENRAIGGEKRKTATVGNLPTGGMQPGKRRGRRLPQFPSTRFDGFQLLPGLKIFVIGRDKDFDTIRSGDQFCTIAKWSKVVAAEGRAFNWGRMLCSHFG